MTVKNFSKFSFVEFVKWAWRDDRIVLLLFIAAALYALVSLALR